MGRFRVSLLMVMILLVISVSCKPQTPALPPTELPTALPTALPIPTELPTTQPTSVPTVAPTQAPTLPPTQANLYLPNGFAAYSEDNSKVNLFDLQGQLITDLQTPNIGTGPNQFAAVLGPLSSAAEGFPPVVFFAGVNSGELWVNQSNNTTKLMNAGNLVNLVVAPGKSTLAFSMIEYQDVGLRSLLYVADLQSLPTAQPIMENTNTESNAIKPVALSFSGDNPAGVWYTTVPNGIGGDIVFEPSKGLNYLELATNSLKSYLDMVTTPAGLSQDQTWVAYSYAEGVSPISIAHNFDFSTAITLPLREDSDRGAGDAVFSPDNQYVAWREVGGSLSGEPPFHEIIRIASVDGTIVAEIPDTSLLETSGFSAITWLKPVGWLDTQTLVLEARKSWDSAALLSVKFDGTGLTYLAPGLFINFLYPKTTPIQ